MPVSIYIAVFVAGAICSAASAPFWRAWCRRRGLVDDPGRRKIHTKPTALAGGLAVMTGLLVPLAAGTAVAFARQALGPMTQDFISATDAGLFRYGLTRRGVELAGVMVGALGMLAIGLRDDQVELRPAAKFSAQLAAALVVAATGTRITLFVHSIVFSYAITVLWILSVVNALNFMDNMNGLCGGLGLIGAAALGAVSAARGEYLVGVTAFLIAGALAGFLPFNYPKASIFLGDSGSHLVGFLLAALGILPHFYTKHHPKPWGVLTPVVALAVPLGDMAWVVWLRWRMGKPFYVGDTNHLSHRLARRGLSQPAAVALIWLMAAAAGAAAFLVS